jgi:hypothetical protein
LVLDLDEDGHQRTKASDPGIGHLALARMSYQSIARARVEGKAIGDALGDAGEGADVDEGGVGRAKGTDAAKKGAMQETEASEARRLWAEKRGNVPGGPANFYKEVPPLEKKKNYFFFHL